MAVEILSGMPSTAPLLLRAALTARLPRGETVPERTLVVEGVRVDRDRLAAYQRLTGYAVDDTIPQPYPWVLAFPVQTALMARRDFPVPLPGMVHLATGSRPTAVWMPRTRSPCRWPRVPCSRTGGAARSTCGWRRGWATSWSGSATAST